MDSEVCYVKEVDTGPHVSSLQMETGAPALSPVLTMGFEGEIVPLTSLRRPPRVLTPAILREILVVFEQFCFCVLHGFSFNCEM